MPEMWFTAVQCNHEERGEGALCTCAWRCGVNSPFDIREVDHHLNGMIGAIDDFIALRVAEPEPEPFKPTGLRNPCGCGSWLCRTCRSWAADNSEPNEED